MHVWRSRTPVPLATGEIEAGRWRFQGMLDKAGGADSASRRRRVRWITEWRRNAATAASYGVNVCPHWFHDLHVAPGAATPNARLVELFTDDRCSISRKLIDRQLEFKAGRFCCRPSRPWDSVRQKT